MPDDLNLLNQLEEWLEAQIPPNLHDLPFRMLETMERVSNELFETLNLHGPPSISLPFPPFGTKDVPAPPPPPPISLSQSLVTKADKACKAHPFFVGGAALTMAAGLGIGGILVARTFGYNLGLGPARFRNFSLRTGTRGLVEDGMLKEAIVLLSPSPTPPLLLPLSASLLKSGYVVIVAVPHVKEAEALERRLIGLEERSSLRVLIYDPEDNTTFPPFQRSLLATLTLRFPAPGKYTSSDPYNPQPHQVPHIHTFISLYPLNPSPPSQPGALPALPTLLGPGLESQGRQRKPTLINLYPSSSVISDPNAFASQVLTTTHQLLGRNLAASSTARVISVYIGHVDLPTLPAILSETKGTSRRQQASLELKRSAGAGQKASVIRDYVFGTFTSVYHTILGQLGIGSAGRSYSQFEWRLLHILRKRHFHDQHYSVGQYSYLSLALSRVPLLILPPLLSILPALPPATGPLSPVPARTFTSATASVSASASASSSDHEHEGGEDLSSSMHTGTSASASASASSRGGGNQAGYESSGSGTGLDGSWVGLDGN